QLLLKRQAAERAVLTMLGHPDDCKRAAEGKPAHEPGTKGHGLEHATRWIHPAQMTGARLEEPELAFVDPGRVWHGERVGDDVSAGNVHDAATPSTLLSPAVRGVRAGSSGREPGNTTGEGEPIEMTPEIGRASCRERA